MELKKATAARLRDLGPDERWLQDRIAEDSVIGQPTRRGDGTPTCRREAAERERVPAPSTISP